MPAILRLGGTLGHFLIGIALVACLGTLAGFTQESALKPRYQVKIEDEKPGLTDAVVAVDPAPHAQLTSMDAMAYGLRVDKDNLNLATMYNWFRIDGQLTFPGPTGKVVVNNQPLPNARGGQPRVGHRSVWEHGQLVITEEVEVIATRSKAGAGRRRDAVLVRYTLENKDAQPHTIGVRAHFNEVSIMNQRGPLFAAPNHPNQVLDGVELKGDKVPDYLQLLEKPDLRNPGFTAHVTLNLGAGYERATRIALTHTTPLSGDMWDAAVGPARGNTGMVLFWDPREIKPKSTRKVAYAFGQGLAPRPDGDGVLALKLSGSFDPGKLFTVAAMVQDPAEGQSLTLELPAGVDRVEGKDRQPVPPPNDEGHSLVLWRARVLEPGRFAVRVRSSTGVTQGKIITVDRAGGLP